MGTFSPGDVIAQKYRVERTLGTGGMGYVVAARHLQLGHLVALKFVRAGMIEGEEAHKRFFREAKAAARLRSDHVCRVLDVAVLEDKTPYMVMEHLEGCDLSTLMKEKGPLDPSEACDYILQACEGLAEAHAAGIVHRDIKPANLFLTKGPGGLPLVKILDFGISKTEPIRGAGDSGVTATKAMLGSPRFMSPEQIRDPRTVDPRSDVWSLGIVLYRLLTGKWPFEAENLGALISRVATAKPVDPREHAPDLPDALVEVIYRCLEKERGNRFGSVGELGHELIEFTSTPDLARLSVERIYDLLSNPSSGEVVPIRPPSEESSGWGATGVAARSSGFRVGLRVGGIAIGLAIGILFVQSRRAEKFATEEPPRLTASAQMKPMPLDHLPTQAAAEAPRMEAPRPAVHPPPTAFDPRLAQPAAVDPGPRPPSGVMAVVSSAPPETRDAPETAKGKRGSPRVYVRPQTATPRPNPKPPVVKEESSNGIPSGRE